MFPEYDVIGGRRTCWLRGRWRCGQYGLQGLCWSPWICRRLPRMSCNPAMGGVGQRPDCTGDRRLGWLFGHRHGWDHGAVSMLNPSKGPAMWSPRAQSDRMLFARKMAQHSSKVIPTLISGRTWVSGLLVGDRRIEGVSTSMGHDQSQSGRADEWYFSGMASSMRVINSLEAAPAKASKGHYRSAGQPGTEAGRTKTGTPPRLDGRAIDYSQTEIQYGDERSTGSAFTQTKIPDRQLQCHITYNEPQRMTFWRRVWPQSDVHRQDPGPGPQVPPVDWG